MTDNELIGWHHLLNGREFEQTPGDGEGQGGLACCHAWDHRVRYDRATKQQSPAHEIISIVLVEIICKLLPFL